MVAYLRPLFLTFVKLVCSYRPKSKNGRRGQEGFRAMRWTSSLWIVSLGSVKHSHRWSTEYTFLCTAVGAISSYVSKIMLTHGRFFNCTELFSRYCCTKHWVDDHNNQRHDPIGLEEVWTMKWWHMQQFTFICRVVEVNACYSQARGRREAPIPQLNFLLELAQQLPAA